MTYKLGIYGNHLFDRFNPSQNHQQLVELQHSGFNYVNLSYLHIDPNANLYYNSTPVVVDGIFANFNYLPELLANLKSRGSVKQVFFTIGGAGSGDFASVEQLLATEDGKTKLIESLSALTSALPVDGFDFDDELTYNAPSMAKFGQIISGPAAFGGLAVTYCPYTNQPFWYDAVKQTFEVDQQFNLPQSVQFWNLQCYSGGSGNDAVKWAKGLPPNIGISDPKGFVVPVVSPGQQGDPKSVRAYFSKLAGTGVDGGAIYNFENIPAGFTARDYADAIVQGLDGIHLQKKAS